MMNALAMLPSDLLACVVYAGVALTVGIYVPVKLVAKWRRVRRARVHLTCRICGFRFIRRSEEAICPHCQSRN